MKKIIPYILILVILISAGFISPSKVSAVECTPVTPDKAPSNTPDGCTHTVSVTISPASIKPGNPATIAIVVNPDPTSVNTTIDFRDNDSAIKNVLSKSLLICTDTRNLIDKGPQCEIAFIPTKEMVGNVTINYTTTVSKVVNFRSKSEPAQKGILSVKVDPSAATSTTTANVAGGSTTRAPVPSELNFGCGITGSNTITGCVAEIFYNILFVPAAALARFAAIFLDFFVYYSTNSSSYASQFVEKSWGAVRDIANIFFIVALLYIAIKTILSLEGSHSKKLIANIIIVALIINFSLFITKVVIDSSNILAKVFYNNISSSADPNALRNSDSSFKTSATGLNGEKSISIGLVRQFDPQQVITAYKDEPGQFIFVILLSTALILFMSYIFISVGVLFVARVVSLWISMIFAPLAFISYTVPFDIPGFGHKKWWDELLKNAFLAPLFIFFLYIIILFGDFFKFISVDTANADFTQKLMKTIIPFAIIFILLQKAKKLAVEYSGDMGKGIMSAAKVVGGFASGAALGVATGGAAIALRGTVGRGAANLAESNRFRDWAANTRGGQFISNRVTGIAGRSFDVRKTSAGKSIAKSAGINIDAGKSIGLGPKEGFTQNRAASVKKQEEFVKKQLDVSDYGKAELTRGGMDPARAQALEQRMIDGGMAAAVAATRRAELEQNGIAAEEVNGVARFLTAIRREDFANRKDRRVPGLIGVPGGPAQRVNATSRILANKIRESAPTAAANANIARLTAQLAAAQAAGGNQQPQQPAPGGGAPTGGSAHP